MLDLLIKAVSYVLVPMFLIGMAGSALVVGITLIHDIGDFFSDNGEGGPAQPDQLS